MATQFEQVKKWLPEFGSSMYSFNTQGSRYYAYTFYKRNAWDGEFGLAHELEDMKSNYRHVIDLQTGLEV